MLQRRKAVKVRRRLVTRARAGARLGPRQRGYCLLLPDPDAALAPAPAAGEPAAAPAPAFALWEDVLRGGGAGVVV